MKTKLLITLFFASLSISISAQTVIPDALFENYLETHDAIGNTVAVGDAASLGDGINGNNLVTTTKVASLTSLSLQFAISDLTGIGDFTSLTILQLFNATSLTSLDLTTNSNLEYLTLRDSNNLSNLNITGLTNLKEVTLSSSNLITSLDFSTLTSLDRLAISNYSQLSSLNIKTGFTASIGFIQLINNSLLNCVVVDAGIPASGVSTWDPLNTQVFDENCSQPLTFVPDVNFENYLETHDASGVTVPFGDSTSMGNGIANDQKVFTNQINTVTNLAVSNLIISDLTGIKNFSALVNLDAGFNSLADLNIENNTNLEKLVVNDNLLTDIKIDANIALKELVINNNAIKLLQVSKNLNLERLEANMNDIENLDLSLNINLHTILLNTNKLKTLNLKNIPNTTISSFNALMNSTLSCIQVDDAAYWNTTFSSQVDSSTTFSQACNYPETNIPDTFFETYLETHDRDGNIVAVGDITSMGNGVANDGKVFTHAINTVLFLDTSNLGVSNLIGLEDFTDLEVYFTWDGNPLLTSVDFSNNLKLKRISFTSNPAATSITFGNLPDVNYLQLGNNNIASVDITGLPSLEVFKEFNGLFTTLDTSNNPNLKTLGISSGAVNSLDLSANVLLENLTATGTNLAALDLTNNINLLGIQLTGNPNLECIQVSNVPFANANWTSIDSQHSFSTDCSTVWGIVASAATNTALLSIAGLDASGDGIISLAEAAAYTGTLDLSNMSITDVEGLQAFTGITTLNVSGNGISDLTPLTGSTFTVIARGSGITRVVNSSPLALENIILSNNNFEVLDLDSFTNLTTVDIGNNQNLKTVSFRNGSNAAITAFNSVNSPLLTCIFVDDVSASYLNTWVIDTTSTFVADKFSCGRVLSLESLRLEMNIAMYPNPVEDKIFIEVPANVVILSVEIYNRMGAKIATTKTNDLDFSKYSSGLYIVKLTTDKGVFTEKIIKK